MVLALVAVSLRGGLALGQGSTEAPGSGDASAPATTDVAALVHLGLAQYRKQNFEAAYSAFTQAWRLRQHADIAASLATVEMKLGRYRDAAEHWSFYLHHTQTSRDEAEVRLAECRAHLAALRLSVSDPEAEVFLNDQLIDPRLLSAELWLKPGEYTVRAVLHGRSQPERRIALASGQEPVVLFIPIADQPAPVSRPRTASRHVPAHPSKNEHETESSLRPALLIAGSASSVAALGIGIAFALRAQSLHHSASAAREAAIAQADQESVATSSFCLSSTRPPPCDNLKRLAQEELTAGRVALGAFVGAGVLGAATLAALVLLPRQTGASASARLDFAPIVGAGELGVQLSGCW